MAAWSARSPLYDDNGSARSLRANTLRLERTHAYAACPQLHTAALILAQLPEIDA